MINVYLLLDSLLSPLCASGQPDRHARDNRTQLTANILNLPKKARDVLPKSPRPSADRAELPCTLFPGCLSDAPETIKKLPLLFLIRPADSEKQRQYND